MKINKTNKKKIKNIKNEIAYLGELFIYFKSFVASSKDIKKRIINIYKMQSEIIDEIIWEIDNYPYDVDEDGVLFSYLNSFAITIYNKFLHCQKIKTALLLSNNKFEYEAHTNRASIVEQILCDLREFEVWIYSQRYSVDIFMKEIVRKIIDLNLIKKEDNKITLTKILPEFNKKMNKRYFVSICNIVQLLNNKNICWKTFIDRRNEYIHEGHSLFDFSEYWYPIEILTIIKRFSSLYEIFTYFLFNYWLILLWLKTKLI